MHTGLGGVFIKADDPRFLARWYDDNLGIGFRNNLHFSFKWKETETAEHLSQTVFSFFKKDTTYFYPGSNDLMLNFLVKDLDTKRIEMRKCGSVVMEGIETYDYGRFGWVIDPEGNKVELWEPVDSVIEERDYLMDRKNVTGIGGVYLKSGNPEKLMKWYSIHLGLYFENTVHTFHWLDINESNKSGQTQLSFLPSTSIYFQPSLKSYMLNFRVDHLNEMLHDLKKSGETVSDKVVEFEYGKFSWVLDPEENKIELWEPRLR